MQGLPIIDGRYSGGDFGWFSPFAVLCGASLCVGYALLGACWLILKCEGEVRETAYRQLPFLAVSVLSLLVTVFICALAEDLRILERWFERPYLFVFPVIGAIGGAALAVSAKQRRDAWPFYMVVLIFVSAFLTLAISFWPFMLPYQITIAQAAAPKSSLSFMFWGAVLIFPMMLIYTAISYRVFRGKVPTETVHS